MDVLTFVLLSGWVAAVVAAFGLHLMARTLRHFRNTSQTYKLVSEHSSDGVVLQNIDGTIIWCNSAYCKMMGRPRKFWIGRKPQKWVFPPETCPTDEEIENFRYDSTGEDFEPGLIRENMRADGSRFWNQFAMSVVESMDGEPQVVLTCRDVSEQVEREDALADAMKDLERAVNFDSLTGLANRRMLMDFLHKSLREAASEGTRVGLIHMDLDKFKEINDTHGHAAGDAVLVHAAECLQRALAEDELATRIGGDEFIVIRKNVTALRQMEALAEGIFAEMSETAQWNGINLIYSASLGISLSEPGQIDGEELIQKADFALYEAKASGRGTVALYDTALKTRHIAQKGMAEDLADVIREGGLEFHFQPIVDLVSFKVAGIETLARWNHPRRGLISPVEFIAIAEDIGLLEDIDLAAMNAALDAYKTLFASGHQDFYVSFNASFQTLSNNRLADQLVWATDAADAPHSSIVVEILETVLLGENAADTDIARQIMQLTKAGFGTRLDDFGIGYAGLSHLAQLQVNGIKIDRSLVRTVLTDPTSEIIVRSILTLASELELDVVAEGVEDGDIAHKLLSDGCTQIQGYGVARPMPLPDLVQWMTVSDPVALLQQSKAIPDSQSA